MGPDKIRITWAETQSAAVDAALKHQEALRRAREHHPSGSATVETGPPPGGATSPAGAAGWYNALAYMAVFGAVGGLLAWAFGEISQRFEPRDLPDFQEAMAVSQQIEAAVRDGRLGKEQGETALRDLKRKLANNAYFKAANDPNAAPELVKSRIEAMVARDQDVMYWVSFIWFSICGTILGLALALAEPVVSRNWRAAVIDGSTGATLGLLGGIVLALFVNRLYRAMGGGLPGTPLAAQIVARSIAWAVLGVFLGLGAGIVMKSWKRFGIGLAGGAIGGLLGGLVFDPMDLAFHSGAVSRCFGVVAIGTFVGLGTGLIENIAKSGWLRVVAGLIAGKQFILYRNPTYIGSSPQCEIYLFKDPRVRPRHAALHRIPGGFEIEDLQSDTGTYVNGAAVTRARLRHGDRIQIGTTCFVFQEKAHAST